MKIRMSVEQQNINLFLKNVIEKYHFNESDKDDLMKVYEEMQISMGPYASYRINQRVTGIKLIDDNQSAIVAMTLGVGIDRLSERYIRAEKLNEAYMLDCISNELLLRMYGEFNEAYARFHRRYVQRYVFIGNEIPVTAIPKLLEEVKGRKAGTQIQNDESKVEDSADGAEPVENQANRYLIESNEITANEYGVLMPSKSVIFYAVLSENPNQVCEGICTGCNNSDCENRMVTRIQENSQRIIVGEAYDQDSSGEDKKNLNYGFQRIFGS